MNSLVKFNSIVGRQRLLIGFPREFGGSFLWRFYLVILNACRIGRCLLSTTPNSCFLKFVMKMRRGFRWMGTVTSELLLRNSSTVQKCSRGMSQNALPSLPMAGGRRAVEGSRHGSYYLN